MFVFVKHEDLPSDNDYVTIDYPDYKNEILIYNSGSAYHVFSSFCPHFGGPLKIKNGRLHCHFHDYYFSLHDGSCENRGMGARCRVLNYFKVDGGIEVEI